jgi:hypothetical protein
MDQISARNAEYSLSICATSTIVATKSSGAVGSREIVMQIRKIALASALAAVALMPPVSAARPIRPNMSVVDPATVAATPVRGRAGARLDEPNRFVHVIAIGIVIGIGAGGIYLIWRLSKLPPRVIRLPTSP